MGKIYDQFRISEPNFSNLPLNKIGHVRLISFSLEDKSYVIFFTRKRANRYSIIHCKGNTIEWEQFPVLPRIAGRRYGISEPILSLAPTKNSIRIFVVKGKPNSITGLDEGIFRSVHKYDEGYINVMSEARFKEI